MATFVDAVEAPAVPVTVAVSVTAVGIAETVNIAEVDPATTATAPGTVSDAVLLRRVTDDPFVGAGFDRVTVHVAFAPPTICDGVHVMLLTGTVLGTVTFTCIVLVRAASAAVSVTAVADDPDAVAVN
jgi:hypothetical protein